MPTALDKLAKILDLERKSGYRDRAVIGGLEKFLPGWAATAASEPGGSELVEQVNAILANYSTKTPDERAAAVERVLELDARTGPNGRGQGQRGSRSPRPPREDAPPPAPENSDPGVPPPAQPLPSNDPGKEAASTPDPSDRPDTPATTEPQAPPPPQQQEPRRANRPQNGEAAQRASASADKPSSAPAPLRKKPPEPQAPASQRSEQPEREGGIPSGPVAVADPPAMPRVSTPKRGPAATIPATGNLDGPVTQIPGVSAVYAKNLSRLGVETIRDLLFLIPRRYDDFSRLKTIHQLMYGEEATIVGTVQSINNRRSAKGMTITTCVLSDATGYIQATWFNQPYLLQQLRAGRQIVLSGRVDSYLGKLVYQSPEWEPLDQELVHTGRLVPVYPLTQGIGPRWMRNTLKRVVDAYAPRLTDPMPSSLLGQEGLMPLSQAVQQAHFPDNPEALDAARRRLAFDEFLLIQLGVLRQRRAWQANTGRPLSIAPEQLDGFTAALPFALTGAQQRVLGDILRDMSSSRPMSRLLQGDVGSGKTVVAATAMMAAWANGAQAALMAPTEILAEQHAKSLRRLFARWADATGSPAPEVALLTGSLGQVDRRSAYGAIAAGETPFVVGTHAVIQADVEFANLGLAIVDEQHRFGVGQRSLLRQKGRDITPHLLVMTATPIPRTLALTIYGDLDLSIIDEMPPGRTPIKTKWVLPRERERAYSFVESQVQSGRQAFVICPLIEESENMEAKAAVQEYERLQQQIFPHLRLGLLHGKMKAAEKESVMADFYRGDIHILVSTSVVEVGIDVPNATVMLIEGANRFGLAQLHQFRGRVGRGQYQSYCLLVADDGISEEGKVRLEAMERTQDGFELAEEDLKLRGPGEFFGTRQSGLPDLAVAKLSDVKTLEQARRVAEQVFEADADLSQPEHEALRRDVDKFWSGEGDLS
ncbi:MAG: ATP-dependent DNA helicase RecG [Anaerolineae bacterium]